MSYGVRRTLLGALSAIVLLVAVGLHFVLSRHILAFGILSFVLAVPFAAGVSAIVLRLRKGGQGTYLAEQPWTSDAAGLLITRPLATADDLMRKYVVLVDGKRQAALRYGDAVEVQVAPGDHKRHAILDGTDKKSDLLDIEIMAGRRVTVYVEPFASSTTIRKATDKWISLTEDA